MNTWTLGPYRALGHRFDVEGDAGDVVRERLAATLEPLLTDVHAESRYFVEDRRSHQWDRHRLLWEGAELAVTPSSITAAGYVQWHVNQEAVRSDRGHHLMLHAAAVQRDGITVVLPAAMDSGKSTTTAGLLRDGYRYATDEAVALDRQSFRIDSYPKALALDRSAVELVGHVQPPSPHCGREEHQWHVPWWGIGSAGTFTDTVPDLFVLPRYRERTVTKIERMTPGEAAFHLSSLTFEFAMRPQANLEAAARLAATTPVYQLAIGSLGEAVAAINSVVNELLHQSWRSA